MALGALAAARWGFPFKDRLAPWLDRPPEGIAAAQAAYDKKDWKRAADLARRLVKNQRSDIEAMRIYARASVRLGRNETASVMYKDMLQNAFAEPEDLFLQGLLLVRTGQLESARDMWDKAAQAGPDHAELLDHLAQLSIRFERLDDAASAASRLARQPGWEVRGLLLSGQIQSLLENSKGAVDALRKALELDPKTAGAPFPNVVYRRLLAQSLLQLGQAAEARQQLETVLAAAGPTVSDPATNWLLSRAFLQEGKTAEATAALARAGSFRTDHQLMAEPSPYVGAAACAPCHAKESRLHERTRHARTFHRGRALLELPIPDHPIPDPHDPKIIHTFERDNDRIRVQTKVNDHVYQLVVEYAFGTKGSYMTMIGRDDEKTYRALRVSSVPSAHGTDWVPTGGDVVASHRSENVRGEPITVRDGVVRCVYCHVTQPRNFRDPPPEVGIGPEAADAAIGCERCHGPGANHVAAIKAGLSDRAIVNIGTAPADAITTQCADCHKVGLKSAIIADADNPKHVRSPAVTLEVSRCYTESEGGMSCLTCHDPHRTPEKSPAYYEAKCLSCHARQENGAVLKGNAVKNEPPLTDSASRKTVCPVNPVRDCLNCHMPKVELADLHVTLTDHYIRIRKH
jgi:tetratricopeptide (TPR) repeat protein